MPNRIPTKKKAKIIYKTKFKLTWNKQPVGESELDK